MAGVLSDSKYNKHNRRRSVMKRLKNISMNVKKRTDHIRNHLPPASRHKVIIQQATMWKEKKLAIAGRVRMYDIHALTHIKMELVG